MSETIDTFLSEDRTFPPSAEFKAQANANDVGIYEQAYHNPEGFWEEWANKLDWFEKWHTTVEFTAPNAKWFLGGKLNAAYNCVDRHALGDRAKASQVTPEPSLSAN
jgi:acetyl-CoA synthetase